MCFTYRREGRDLCRINWRRDQLTLSLDAGQPLQVIASSVVLHCKIFFIYVFPKKI
jgi:hypothetical protein